MWSARVIIVIRAVDREAANNAFAARFDPLGGHRTFTNGLSQTGKEPALYYWANVAARREQLKELEAFADAFPRAEMFIWDEIRDGVIDHINSRFDAEKYRNENAQTRGAARVRIAKRDPAEVLATLGLKVVEVDDA